MGDSVLSPNQERSSPALRRALQNESRLSIPHPLVWRRRTCGRGAPMTLDSITKIAQCEATRQQRAVSIWNLNRYSPMYVVRDAREGDAKRNGYVATVQPQTDRIAADNPTV